MGNMNSIDKKRRNTNLKNSPGYGNPLFLTSREHHTTFPNERVKALWEAQDELVGIGLGGCLNNIITGYS